jgi:hypothetical protein
MKKQKEQVIFKKKFANLRKFETKLDFVNKSLIEVMQVER